MKHCIAFLFFMLMAFGAAAQSISVADFQLRETDMTAASLAGRRIDQNGQPAALIRIETAETGFVFEAGALGIVDSKQETGEVWVWVPRASRKITIKHPKLGVLYDYRYPLEIEAERTYWMKLVTGKVITTIQEEVRMQYLTFQITPPNATLEVNDQLWSLDADGIATKYVDFGTYTYRVRAADYFPDAGRVVVDDPNNTKVVPVTLKSNRAEVTLKVDADAEIWVNNERKGTRTWTGSLGNGTFRIECRQAGHESTVVSKEITAEMNGQTIILSAPQPIYGSLGVESTPQMATLYIDGKEMGKTPKSVNQLLVGEHEIKLVKEGFSDYMEMITIAKGERKQVKAKLSKQNADVQTVANITSTSAEDLTFEVGGVSFTMKFVEGGIFRMGASSKEGSDAFDDEKPVHSVTLSSYFLGETEVTQALWKAVMGSNPSRWQDDNRPVENVSWNDCQEFIRELNQQTGKNFRLPTEAEWEYAARGGKKSNGYKYAGSNKIRKVAKVFSLKTRMVKLRRPNELGLYDMTANVLEWCQDWYASDYYKNSPSTNPQGPSTGSERVLRGGWYYYYGARYWRVLTRYRSFVDERNDNRGLRLCLPK